MFGEDAAVMHYGFVVQFQQVIPPVDYCLQVQLNRMTVQEDDWTSVGISIATGSSMLHKVPSRFVIGPSIGCKFALRKPHEVEDNIAVKPFPRKKPRPQPRASFRLAFHDG